mmetsp:Transcript_16651/g.35239  ORF Transcript_16651/g.35239 Transcript_16651/m.35239 type:complete len:217 (-) Transcript_16651:464-1114(-)
MLRRRCCAAEACTARASWPCCIAEERRTLEAPSASRFSTAVKRSSCRHTVTLASRRGVMSPLRLPASGGVICAACQEAPLAPASGGVMRPAKSAVIGGVAVPEEDSASANSPALSAKSLPSRCSNMASWNMPTSSSRPALRRTAAARPAMHSGLNSNTSSSSSPVLPSSSPADSSSEFKRNVKASVPLRPLSPSSYSSSSSSASPSESDSPKSSQT